MARDNLARGLALSGPRILGQSAVAVSHTGDTAEFTLATITIPAGAMGNNGQVEIEAAFSMTNNANAKSPRFKFGGTAMFDGTVSGVGGQQARKRIANRNATNSQVTFFYGAINDFSSSSGVTTAAIDTTQPVNITITGQLAVATDTITLESYRVLLYPLA